MSKQATIKDGSTVKLNIEKPIGAFGIKFICYGEQAGTGDVYSAILSRVTVSASYIQKDNKRRVLFTRNLQF